MKPDDKSMENIVENYVEIIPKPRYLPNLHLTIKKVLKGILYIRLVL